MDPDARELSPGVLMVERYMRRALERGIGRLDFLRGDEPYKYEWGAVDEPIQRVLVRRTDSAMTPSRRLQPLPRARSGGPAARRPERIRVVQVLATGTNGGAQEHVYNLVSRAWTATRYDVSVVSLSPGSARAQARARRHPRDA